MTRVIAIANHKGGAVKTSSSFHLAGYYAVRLGAKVLLCDCDPQGTLTKFCGYDPKTIEPSLAEALLDPELPISEIARPTPVDGVFLLPASRRLRTSEHSLRDQHDGVMALRRAFRSLPASYDYVLLDCPPALDLLNMNALVATHYVLIPCGSSMTDLQELVPFLETVEVAREGNPDLVVAGIFLTHHQPYTTHSRVVLEALQHSYPKLAMQSSIPFSTHAKDSTAAGLPLELYNRQSPVAQAYANLANELDLRTALERRHQLQELRHHA